MLSTSEDYLTWLVTFLPILTGWLAYHRIVNPYPLVLAPHPQRRVLMVVCVHEADASSRCSSPLYNGASMAAGGAVMSSLTLERGLYDFKAAIDAPIASFFSSCVHCGCAPRPACSTSRPATRSTRRSASSSRCAGSGAEYTILGRIKKASGCRSP